MNALPSLPRLRWSRTSQGAAGRGGCLRESWPNPKESVGRFLTKIGAQSCWEAVGPARTAFQSVGGEIKNYLDNHSEPLPRWVTWSIYMVGDAPEIAIPTIIFCCEDESHRKAVRNMIKESNILVEYPGIALKHLPRAPDYNQLVQLASQSSGSDLVHFQASDMSTSPPVVFCSATRITPGTQLFIRPNRNSNLIEKATAGGLLRVGNKHYLMTAAHAFVVAPEPCITAIDEELYFTDSDDDDIEVTSRGSRSPQPSNSTDTEDSISAHFRRLSTMSSPSDPALASELAGSGWESTVESDVATFEECPFDQAPSDLPATASPIGTLVFSSIDGPHPELDYALIEMWDDSLLDDGHASIDVPGLAVLNSVTRESPTHATTSEVVLFTASSGLMTGSLSATPAYIRPPNVERYQEVHSVLFYFPLSKGDCGSWVTDPKLGMLHGHIVAGSPETGSAYMVPSNQVLEDIQRRWHQVPIPCLGKTRCEAESMQSFSHAAADTADPHVLGRIPPEASRHAPEGQDNQSKNHRPSSPTKVLSPLPTSTPVGSRHEQRDIPDLSPYQAQQHSGLSSWTWSDAYQDYYCYSIDGQGNYVYHWYKQTLQPDPLSRPKGDSGSYQEATYMPERAPTELRALTDFIPGTPERGWYEPLDSSFRMRTGRDAYNFFKIGKVFSMLHIQAATEDLARQGNDNITVVKYGEHAYSQIRSFVIVEVRRGFVYACPIYTYSGRGTLKPGCNPSEHAVVYFMGEAPKLLPGEYLTKMSIAVAPAEPSLRMDPASRVQYSKVFPIEMNVKVKDIGDVIPEDISTLIGDYKENNLR